jgi:hypothetical protein
MNNNSLLNFAYGDHLVRTVDREGTPWFVAADVCAVLDIQNARDAVAKALDDDEKGVDTIYTLGGTQEMLVISEPGLYRLVFKSRKPQARAFQRWVYHQVLPTIRRTGSYTPAHQSFLGLVREQIALGVSPDLAARMAGRLVPQEKPAARALLDSRPHPHDAEIDEILSHLQPEASYTIPTVIAALPSGHRLRRGSAAAQSSAVGKVLSRAVRQQRLERDPDFPRTATFRLPQVVAFWVSQ